MHSPGNVLNGSEWFALERLIMYEFHRNKKTADKDEGAQGQLSPLFPLTLAAWPEGHPDPGHRTHRLCGPSSCSLGDLNHAKDWTPTLPLLTPGSPALLGQGERGGQETATPELQSQLC